MPVAKTNPIARRFYGSTKLRADRLGMDAATIGDEIVKHLQGLMGANVEVRIDISAEVPEGVPEEIVRSSSGGEFHPSALTEPDVKLSPHPAPTLQPPVSHRDATGQTGWDPVAPRGQASASTHALAAETV